MALVIPDNYRSLEGVSASIARVATAFRNGLDDDAAVWIEPPFDPSGEKPHFVVLFPENGIAVVEVLEVRAAKLLGSLRGKIAVERDGGQVDEDPLGRAETYALILRERIANEPRLSGLRFPVSAFAAFPSLDRDDAVKKGLDGAVAGASLFRDELEPAMRADEGHALGRALARGLGVADPVEGNLVDLVRGLVQPMLVIGSRDASDQLVIFRPPNDEDVVRVMDRRQESLAKSMAEGHRVVRGVAGSGKTLVLVYRARLFAEMYPDQRFLVTCYTRSLASQLRLLLGDHENVDVKHIDGLMTEAIRDARLPHPGYKDDPSGETVAAMAVKALERGALTRYRAVFVDEAQDLGTTALVFARLLVDARYDDLLVVADAAQNIFRRKFSWKQAGISAQGRTRILRVNYRNTREVLELASGFLFAGDALVANENPEVDDETGVVPPKSAARSGPEPTVAVASNGDLVPIAVRSAASLVGEKPVPKKVAVLYLGWGEGEELARGLQQAGIDHYWASDPAHRENRDRIAETVAPVVLSTVHSAKGLEFDSVVLTCTPPEYELGANELRMTLYVGMTRATHQLVVVADAAHPLVDDLREAAESSGRLLLGTDE